MSENSFGRVGSNKGAENAVKRLHNMFQVYVPVHMNEEGREVVAPVIHRLECRPIGGDFKLCALSIFHQPCFWDHTSIYVELRRQRDRTWHLKSV